MKVGDKVIIIGKPGTRPSEGFVVGTKGEILHIHYYGIEIAGLHKGTIRNYSHDYENVRVLPKHKFRKVKEE